MKYVSIFIVIVFIGVVIGSWLKKTPQVENVHQSAPEEQVVENKDLPEQTTTTADTGKKINKVTTIQGMKIETTKEGTGVEIKNGQTAVVHYTGKLTDGTISEGLSKEIFWIKSYMSNCVKYPEMRGLNLTDGGQGTIGYKATDELRKRLSDYHKANPSRGMKGKKISEETKNKIRSSMIRSGWIKPKKIKPTKEETRLKQSLAKKGKPAWNKGIPMLPHVKDALILANKNRESPFKGKDFSHLTQEERNKRFGKHNLGNSYNKGRKHTKEFCERMSLARKGVSNVSLYKKIVRYNKRGELIGIYKSIKDGAYKSGYSEWSIRNICKGLRKTDSNSIFKYAS
jgi:hypothetical protein